MNKNEIYKTHLDIIIIVIEIIIFIYLSLLCTFKKNIGNSFWVLMVLWLDFGVLRLHAKSTGQILITFTML